MCFLAINMSSLEKCLLGLPATFSLGCFLILSYMSCLYILEINPLLVASFENIFSHSEGCLFVLFMVSFAVQKILSLICFHLFLSIFITLGHGLKKILLQFMFIVSSITGLPGGLVCKESACNEGDLGLIPRLGRSPGGRYGDPLQDYCLENPMDRGPSGLQSTKSQRGVYH